MKASRKKYGPRWRTHAMLLALAAGAAQAGQAAVQAERSDTAAAPVAAPPVPQDWAREPAPIAAPVVAGDDAARTDKHYAAAAVEILGFQALLNRVDKAHFGKDYDVSMGSIRRNLRSSWVEDKDSFEINQMGHPYQGSVYFGIARSNGLTFWESLGYSFAGSAVWEIAGETTPPSRNDQITTSFGGAFLGEALYRMANLVLEQGDLSPGWREAAAAFVSPPLGFNRHAAGRRAGLWASNDPALYSRLQLGAGIAAHGNVGPSLAPKHNEAAADFAMEYGLPGKSGYSYRRPFDYFLFRLRMTNVEGVESLATRGLLFGAPYEGGATLRGIAGLYGSYDYLSPQQFRVASTGLSLGTNLQWRLAENLALQGHASAGFGYTSTGTVRASSGQQYTYGVAPQAMLNLRLVYGDRLSFDLASRGFFDGRLARAETSRTDGVIRGDASVTYRLSGPHAVTLKYITSRRKFSFLNVAERQQRLDTVGLYYTYQLGRGMGVVNW
jgi:hypothetical protein